MSYIVDVRNGIAVKPSEMMKRSVRNEIEKKRRSDLRETLTRLKEHIPCLSSTPHASKALIVKKATEFITRLSQKNEVRRAFILKLRRQNSLIERQIKALESNGKMSVIKIDGLDSETSHSEPEQTEEEYDETNFVEVC